MKTSTTNIPFQKDGRVSCLSDTALVSLRTLSAEAAVLVKDHLEVCDFCSAELPLLAHHTPGAERGLKTPEIPLDLRILAESILAKR